MRIVRDVAQAQPSAPTCVAVGVFDGVHCGHQHLLSQMVQSAHARNHLAAVYTFDPHPVAVLGGLPPSLLTTIDERAEIMADLGVDILVAPPFTLEVARTPATVFTYRLLQDLRMAELWAGPQFALGYQREGTIAMLKQLGAQLGFRVQTVEPLLCEGTRVSSSRIRSALLSGDIGLAARWLGRPYRLSGSARAGTQPGSSLSESIYVYHIQPPPERLIPAPGVYACRALVDQYPPVPAVACISPVDASPRDARDLTAYLPAAPDYPNLPRVSLDFLAHLRPYWHTCERGALPAWAQEEIVRAEAIVKASILRCCPDPSGAGEPRGGSAKTDKNEGTLSL